MRFVPREAEQIYWREYVPVLHFVDVTGVTAPATVTEALQRDPSDLPTATLLGLVAPAFSFASDRDLRAAGYATDKWAHALDNLEHVIVLNTLTSLIVEQASTAIRRLRTTRPAPSPRTQLTCAALMAAAGLGLWLSPELRHKGASAAAATARTLGSLLLRTGMMHGAAVTVVEDNMCSAPSYDNLYPLISRLVAVFGPLSIDEASDALGLSPATVRNTVLACSALVEVNDRIQIGRVLDTLGPEPHQPRALRLQRCRTLDGGIR